MLKYPILALLRCYKWLLSPLLPPACRYTPTCSEYMADAVRHHGALRGVWMGLKRLGRCHPLGGAGYDPVPGVPTPADGASGPPATPDGPDQQMQGSTTSAPQAGQGAP